MRVEGNRLVDDRDRTVVLHGINLVNKGVVGSDDTADYRGEWTREDLEALREIGLNCIRLGVNWAITEPQPGKYNDDHLAWLRSQLDAMHELGFAVVLDAHQDLYSQNWANGAPGWATLTSEPFEATDLWSDAYLSSPAVHEALDAFWRNAPGPGDVGLQDRFADFWHCVATNLGNHPAVIGYDVLNEPTPGSEAELLFGGILAAFAEATGQEFDAVMESFSDPARKLQQLAHLDNVDVHHAVGDAVASLSEAFETQAVAPLFSRVVARIREADSDKLILREHNYFANLGVPSGIPALDDDAWAYSPHGYDLVVDTEAMPLASDRRITTIFERAAETAERLRVPVIVGEWGAFNFHEGIARHCETQLDFFDAQGWSWIYWCWEPGVTDSEALRCLKRPRPVAVAGDELSWGTADGAWSATWRGGAEESEFFIPEESTVSVTRDGAEVAVARDGSRVVVPPGSGIYRLTVN